MRLSCITLLAMLFVVSQALPGCGRSRSAPPETEKDEAETEEVKEEPPPEPEKKPAEEIEPEPEPEEPSTPEREARELYQTGNNLYREAREAWRTFRDGGKKMADWERANDLLVQAQERCDEAVEKDETFERVHDLLSQINEMRRTLMDTKPE
ncbi:MAG: hypothetical protein O7H41_17675 [Planctomycetota bacterium]|nr:hypothetical protein [Planctomycetota bacterium]